MKCEDYNLMELCLTNAYDFLMDAYENCDTSFQNEKYETEEDVAEWNQRLNQCIEELKVLKEEMLFTFQIEDYEKE